MRSIVGRPAALLLVVLVAAALPAAARGATCSRQAPPDPAVPTWQRVNGFALGDRPATDEEIGAYLAAVDRATARVRTGVAGRSVDGRPIPYAIVGEPGAIAPARLAAVASRRRAMADARLDRRRLARAARTDPVFAWIAGSVHSDEPSGADADMALLYELAAGRTCAARARLRGAVTFLLPVQNPDGRAARTRTNAAGFDLNRDWFAATQPETRSKLALLRRYPPTVFADQHEQTGTAFFFPPDTDPIHHEVSDQALRAIDGVFSPALRRAFTLGGRPFTTGSIYDLFFMGYGDTAPTTLFGAAGMTFEKGGQSPYPTRVADHLLAARTTVATAARDHAQLLLAWGRQFDDARAQGTRGTLQPNRVIGSGHRVRFGVPSRRVYAYAIRADRHAADAAALAQRLARMGVRVDRLRGTLRTSALRPWGGGATRAARLPAGTYVVTMAQGAKHWVEAMLGEDAYVPFPYFYDVSSWSNPLLMGLSGGAIGRPLPARLASSRVHAGDAPALPSATSPAYAFAGDSAGAAALACALLGRGAAVYRRPDGAFVTTAGLADVRALAAERLVPVAPATAVPADAIALRGPRVALLDDGAAPGATSGAGLSAGWARELVGRRLGVPVDRLGAAALAAGQLAAGGYTALIVPDAAAPRPVPAAALTAIQAWVRAGGTLVAWRGHGIAVARAAGVTAVTTAARPAGLVVPGASFRVLLDTADPVAWGEQPEAFAFDTGDPIVDAHGAPVVARYPGAARFWASGYTTGAGALRGTAAATDERTGAGRVVLFAFEPAFRDYTEGTMRLVGNALLAPPATTALRGGGARGGGAARAVDPALPAAGSASSPGDDATLVVRAADGAALARAARAAGVPAGATLTRSGGRVTLRVPGARTVPAERRAWALRLPAALRAAGVRPLIATL